MAEVDSNTDVVTFNVGGKIFQMLTQTVHSKPETLLCTLLNERNNDPAREDKVDQPIFVEADAERFRYIVDWYRYGRIHLPEGISIAEMRRECAFYQLPDTVEISTDKPTFADIFAVKRKALEDLDDATTKWCKAAIVAAFHSRQTDAAGRITVNANNDFFIDTMRPRVEGQRPKIAKALGAYASEHGCKCELSGVTVFTLAAKETK